MTKLILLGALMLLAWREKASAQYPGWQHTGSFFIVTTPDGANLPATASEEGFPVLVRFEKGQFDFTQAKADGGDIRFSSEGKPLAYQIESWDAGSQNACVWVRIPLIKGNAQQEIKLYWGKADVSSESNGKAVFNESNGYLAVFHMDDPVKDETGSLVAKDLGTTSTPGMVGKSRHFEAGKGINCGENITTFPTGSSPHSTDIWFRAEKQPDRIVSWGSGGPKTMVQIMAGKPLHAFIDCYGPAGVRGTSSFKLKEWIHVMHTFEGGASKVYVNGLLEGNVDSKEASMDIKNQVQMFMGGWRSYGFTGDIDEVRVSKVARSANWARLQYENQKPMQTLVGPLVQPGSGLAVSVKSIVVKEGANTVVTARAGGARKLFWFVVKDGQETLAAVDRFDFTLNAGRVTSDQSLTLRLKAVFAEGAKSIDIPVTVQEDIPEPVYTLKAPAKWDGRETIEIVPEFANLNAMQAKGASDVKCNWSVSGIAVVRESAPGKLILKHAQASGEMTVTASLSNGGEAVVRSIDIPVQEPAKNVWVQRISDKDEKPVDNQFYARDDTNEGTLFCNGTLTDTADSVFLKLFTDDKLIKTESQKPKADKSYALSVRLKAGLVRYRVELGTRTGTTETVLHKADNLICGDAYIIDGQSNAVAYNYHNSTQPFAKYTNPWIRTYGGNGEAENPTRGGWGNALIERPVPTSPDRVYFIGAWCMSIARKLVEDEKIPVCMLNGAVGGTRIDQHLPDPVDRLNSTDKAHSIYRNLLRRVVDARLTHGIRGVFWHQGEADQGFDGPDNCFGCETHEQYFIDLSAAWKQDMPNLRQYYIYQIWPNACSQGGSRNSDKLRDVQRRLSRLYSHMTVMPTLDLPSGQSCHFTLEDYEKMGLLMVAPVRRDSYGRIFDHPVTAPDVKRAYYTSTKNDEIAIEFDQPVDWSDAVARQFYLDGEEGRVNSGSAAGNILTLKLAAPASAKTITYLTDKKWDHKTLLNGKNGIAALTFCEVPIAPAASN